jgi:hypothetical protein
MARRYVVRGRLLDPDDLMTPGEAADLLDIGTSRLSQLRHAGVISFSPADIRYRYLAAEVIALREHREAQARL